ncbi:MAG: hypothetical protein WKF94_10290 [Solirubrobacteraceae bacterium]
MTRVLGVLCLLSVAFVAPAQAVETEGIGENITHLKNLAYPELHAPNQTNAGTDLEFATITVTGPGATTVAPAPAPIATATPTEPGAPATPAPGAGGPTGSASPGAKPAPVFRKPRACRKLRSASRGSKRRAVLRKRCKAAKRRQDARPRVAGIQRTFSFAGAYGDGLQVIDVTDPANARIVATWDCGISQGDVQLFRRDDLGGRRFVTFTADNGKRNLHEDSACVTDLRAKGFEIDPAQGGTFIAEITDPYNPTAVSFVGYRQGSHNMTVHPSGRYLYNSNSDLITSVLPAIEITDITDVTAPKSAGEFDLLTLPGIGTESHDITFSPDGTRAAVAALSHGEVLDTTDPTAPTRVSTIVDPTLNVWHQMESVTIKDPILGKRNFILAEDEVAGALGTGQCPNGGLHVYDATGDLETAPVLVGYWNISDVGLTDTTLGTCTAHVFQIDHEQQLMTIAFYNGGVRVVDLSGLVGVALGENGYGMRELGSFRFPDSDTWAVKAPKMSRDGFFLYGNDHARGFDVYEYKPGEAPARAGRWMSAAQMNKAVVNFTGVTSGVLALCLRELQ